MPPSTDSKQQATVWLKPEQVEAMRNHIVRDSRSVLKQRNDSLIQFLYDTGLRVGEGMQVDTEHLDMDEGVLGLPAGLQKDYPTDGSPTYTEIELAEETTRVLDQYLSNRWKASPALFPSLQSERMTTEAVRGVVRQAAEAAKVQPHTVRGRGEPTDVTPHTLRHSVAYRMLNHEDGNTLYNVRNRLRHATIQTTEKVYDHFDRV
ncbi:tyrosine-type recombinase/integrase [Haloarchaeobius litoreus]|uniref:Tyrosine-type recombinase/integrase n=1 Tax=Haloarchaeobius litoreus TaxID=755306 RepID=A0ABD6DFQ5_9EURY|nr:tyrosine-type recombinase/integrase [Haloarchaeobius litoreus]